MQHELRCQQNTIGRQEIQMMKLRSQLKRQAEFCSLTGSVLGNCLWKATQIPNIANMVLQEVSNFRDKEILLFNLYMSR